MANTFRHRHGATNAIRVPVDSATVIEIGDLVYLDTDDAKPASSQSDQGNEAANQELFHDNFLGVAMQQSQSGDTDSIRIATTGVFEMAAVSDTYEIGKLVGVNEAASGTALEDQEVVDVGTPNLAVGKVARREASAATSVYVAIVSTVMWGGPQAKE